MRWPEGDVQEQQQMDGDANNDDEGVRDECRKDRTGAADGDGVVLKAHVMAAGADKCPPLSLN